MALRVLFRRWIWKKILKKLTITSCGVGVHYVNLYEMPMYNFSMPLPSPIQTNNRTEIYAVLIVLRNIKIAGKIDFFTDNKICRDTFLKGKYRARLANHADLWTEIFAHIKTKYIDLKIYWMTSHTDSNPKKKEIAPAWMKP